MEKLFIKHATSENYINMINSGILLVSIDSNITDIDYINYAIEEIENRVVKLTVLLFDELEKINLRVLSSLNNETIDWIVNLRKKEIIASINKNKKIEIIGWERFCSLYPINKYITEINNIYENNEHFRRKCENETFMNLQPKLVRHGILTNKHKSISILVRYLLFEIALKIFLANENYFDNEIAPYEEKGILRDIYSGVYIDSIFVPKRFPITIIPPMKPNSKLMIENLNFSYPKKPAFKIDNINMIISTSGINGILGENGAGKSTLLKIIGGHLKPISGKIYLGDKDITNIPARGRSISTVFQKNVLFPHLNVLENVKFGLIASRIYEKKLSEEIALKQLIEFNLENIKNKLPSELSIGIQQKVAIARSMVLKPAVLLLDEPTSSLDYEYRNKFIDILKWLSDSTASPIIIVVSHDKDFLFTICDNIYIMKNGKIIAEGKTEELFMSPPNINIAEIMESGNIITGKINNGDVFSSAEGDINIRLRKRGNEPIQREISILLKKDQFRFSNYGYEDTVKLDGRIKRIKFKPMFYEIILIADNGREIIFNCPHNLLHHHNLTVRKKIEVFYNADEIVII